MYCQMYINMKCYIRENLWISFLRLSPVHCMHTMYCLCSHIVYHAYSIVSRSPLSQRNKSNKFINFVPGNSVSMSHRTYKHCSRNNVDILYKRQEPHTFRYKSACKHTYRDGYTHTHKCLKILYQIIDIAQLFVRYIGTAFQHIR